MNVNYKNRWYDKYPDLSRSLEELKGLKKQDRDKLIHGLKDIILDYDNELFDKHVLEFPMTYRRRWYDKDPFSWLVINALEYVDEDLITDIILYLEEKLQILV